MKKILSFSLVLCVLISLFSVSAYSDREFDLLPFGMKFSVPDGLDVITPDMPATDPVFGKYTFGKGDFDSLFNGAVAYFAALNEDLSCQIMIGGYPEVSEDFTEIKDKKLKEMSGGIGKAIPKKFGISRSGAAMYVNEDVAPVYDKLIYADGAKFLAYDCKTDNSDVTVRIYVTEKNGDRIYAYIILKSAYYKANYDKKTSNLDKIIRNISFSTAEAPSAAPAAAPPESDDVYVDSAANQYFTIPEGWEKSAASDSDSVTFVNVEHPAAVIEYTSVDRWSNLTESDRKKYSRSELNTSKFKPETFDEVENVTVKNTESVTIGNYLYYCYELTVSGDDGNMDCVIYSVIENGREYQFRFHGGRDDECFPQFDAMVRGFSLNITTPAESENSGITGFFLRLLIVIAICAAIAIPVIIIKKRRDAKAAPLPPFDLPPVAPYDGVIVPPEYMGDHYDPEETVAEPAEPEVQPEEPAAVAEEAEKAEPAEPEVQPEEPAAVAEEAEKAEPAEDQT